LKNKEKDVLVLCDTEEEYAILMTEFIKARKEIPWEIRTYTEVAMMLQEERNQKIAVLVIAESSYTEEVKGLTPGRVVILNESGMLKWGQIPNVSKYQQAESVLRQILEVYMEIAECTLPKLVTDSKTKLIGIYSPVKRCLQTSFAMVMGQMLAEKGRTLYLNFEHYAGRTELLGDEQTRDLADLLYFLNTEGEKFRLRMQTIIRQKGQMDYVPPVKSGQNLLTISPREWMKLLQKIAELGIYEYIVLDLSESMQGIFDVLRSCVKVFTLVKEDDVAQSKLLQYEQMLALYQYEDVLQKTCKCTPPKLPRLPKTIEEYTKSELADYVRAQLKELL